MSLVAAFVRNPVKVAVGVLLVGLFGLIALDRMPMQLTPEVQTPTLTIETTWPGASPQEVEREIVEPQEEQLKGVEGVTKMTSECMDSMGRITLEFSVGTDMNEALLKVNARLQQVREYPAEADQPVIQTTNSADQPIAWLILRPRLPDDRRLDEFARQHPHLAPALAPVRAATVSGRREQRLRRAVEAHPELGALLPPPVDMQELFRFAQDMVEARFERVKGVSNSNVLGGREDELQVVVDAYKLADRRLTIEHVRAALAGRNVDTSAGDYWEGKRRYVVRTLGQFRSAAEVESLVLARGPGGESVHLGEVAEVRSGYKKAESLVQNFGTTVLAVNCIRERTANVIEVMEGIYAAVRELNDGILRERGLQIDQVYDETEYIHSAVGLLRDNIVLGGILTFLALLVFLRSARSTVVIALAIPTSLVGTFLMLHLLGRSLNVVSLAGLAFAVGMLVDNAVVVLENVYRRYQAGERRWDAAVKGTQEVWGAVVASTMTTLAVFLPILFIEEEAGQLFRDIAWAISCAVGLSLVVSVTLIPTLTARILAARGGAMAGTQRAPRRPRTVTRWLHGLFRPVDFLARAFVAAVVGLHRWLDRGVLRQALAVAVLVAGAGLGAWQLFPRVEYLPAGNRNLAFGIVLPPPGYNLDQLVALGKVVEDGLRPYWDAEPGSPEAARLDGPVIDHFFFVARGRQVFMGLRAHDPLRAGELVPIIQKVGAALPGTFVVAKQSSLFERGLTAGRTIDVEVTGPSLERLVDLSLLVMGKAREALPPGTQMIPKPSPDLSKPEVHILPRWEHAEDLGFSARALGYAVNSLVDGAYAGDYFVGGTRIDLSILGQDALARRLQDLEALPVATPTGDVVPLKALAHVELRSGPEQINHRERQRAITVEISPPEGMALEDALQQVDQRVARALFDEGALAGGYRITLAGTADKLRATWDALRFNVILAVLITYLLLAALFESWTYPFVILLSVPLGAVGGFLGLEVLNALLPAGVTQPLDVLTMLGFVILIGTVVNNAILIVHQALVHMREEGMEHRPAVIEAVRTRIRPIFMTVTTTVCGLLPLVLVPGAGSELYRGLGSVLIGGLVVSTVFTLVVVPCMFRLFLAGQGALGRLRTAWFGAAEG